MGFGVGFGELGFVKGFGSGCGGWGVGIITVSIAKPNMATSREVAETEEFPEVGTALVDDGELEMALRYAHVRHDLLVYSVRVKVQLLSHFGVCVRVRGGEQACVR